MTAAKVPVALDMKAFLRKIDHEPQFKGCRVVYFDGQATAVVRAGRQDGRNDDLALIIKPDLGPEVQVSALGAQARESKLYSEVLSGVLGCTSAAIGWVVVATGAAAAPVTGGASTLVAVLGYTAAAASSAQCVNSSVRIYNELADPQSNDWLDDQGWYKVTSDALDAVALTAAAVSGAGVLKTLMRMRRAGGKPYLELLKGLSRQDRRRLAEELIRETNPGISNKQLKMLVRMGQYPVRFTGVQISEAMRVTLLEATGAMLDTTSSAREGLLRKGAGWVVGVARRVQTL